MSYNKSKDVKNHTFCSCSNLVASEHCKLQHRGQSLRKWMKLTQWLPVITIQPHRMART